VSKEFELYDLELVVDEINGNCTCSMTIGDKVRFTGGKFSLPTNSDFCLYALQSALPLIPAKQRQNHPHDWMETDNTISCPDPACGLIMKIERVKTTVFDHDEVSATRD
jgi:uncharacterized repeat protein (TIGR04076 family)